jgi:uncharacterized protein (TIGR01244 family)
MGATSWAAARVPGGVNNEAKLGDITVGGQPNAADVARFSTIVNCRPADEPGNVSEALAKAAGKNYVSIPFTGDTLAEAHIDKMREALASAAGPVLVHCQGGTRAAVAVAVVQAEAAGKGAAETVAAIEGAGFEVKDRPYEGFIERYFAAKH